MHQTEGEIKEIRDETHDVKTFVLTVVNRLDFVPGQYSMVCMKEKEGFQKEWRPFTFVNIPEDEQVELTVKRMGKFTTTMHRLRPGDKLILRGPFGEELNFDETVIDDVVFVAGGSGITPFMSAIRFAVARNMQNDIWLFYSNKTIGDIIFREELDELNQRENIRVLHALTKEIPEDWNGLEGRLNKAAIASSLEEPAAKLWYICGPPPMVHAVREMIGEIGVPDDRIKSEDWQIPGKSE
jgi:ferredoxin-NADP reductase